VPNKGGGLSRRSVRPGENIILLRVASVRTMLVKCRGKKISGNSCLNTGGGEKLTAKSRLSVSEVNWYSAKGGYGPASMEGKKQCRYQPSANVEWGFFCRQRTKRGSVEHEQESPAGEKVRLKGYT